MAADRSTPETSAPAHPHERMVLLLACTAQFMVVLDVSVVNVALPSIGRDLHYGSVGLQWVPNAYVLTFAGFLLLGGRIADLFGRRHAFLGGIGLFMAASLLAGAAQTSLWLTGARALQGVGSAILSPATLTIVVTTFPRERLGRAIGVWSAVGSVGGAAGVCLGGVITSALGWRWIFFVNVPVGLAVGAAAVVFLAEHRRTAGARGLDVPGALTVTSGLALLTYAIVSTDQYPWSSLHTLGCLGGAVVLFTVFLVVQLRSRRPLVPLQLLRSRWVSGSNAVVLIMGTWTLSSWYFFSLYLQDVTGYSPLRTGLALTPMAAVIALAAQFASRVALPRFGVRTSVQSALVVLFAGFVWLATLGPGDRYWAGIFGAGTLISVGQGLIWTPLVAAATGGVDRATAGLASGLLNNSRQVGSSIGLATLATVAAAQTRLVSGQGSGHAAALTAGYARSFLVAAVLVAVAVALSPVLPKRTLRRPPPVGAGDAVPAAVLD